MLKYLKINWKKHGIIRGYISVGQGRTVQAKILSNPDISQFFRELAKDKTKTSPLEPFPGRVGLKCETVRPCRLQVRRVSLLDLSIIY